MLENNKNVRRLLSDFTKVCETVKYLIPISPTTTTYSVVNYMYMVIKVGYSDFFLFVVLK